MYLGRFDSLYDVNQTNLHKDIHLMNSTIKSAFVFAIVILLILLFAGWTMAGEVLSVEMMGSGGITGISWVWMPAVLLLCFGVMLVWVVYEQKK